MLKNELYKSKSKYLQQHKDNPVAWQLWGDNVFKLAKELGRPLFISIGYSSCHWCHVMAHESFEDEETAKILNEKFIPVKVDKEEYPDIDKKYQFYIQITNKQGGWPLSIFADENGDPFYAGTYFPKESQYGLVSFKALLNQINDIFHNKKEQVKSAIEKYHNFLNDFYKIDKIPLSKIEYDKLIDQVENLLDYENGGLKGNNKFPNIPYMLLLMDEWDRFEDFLIKTGRKIALSGLYDHINGGFFRYCVDSKWSYPHFEKMLYDNALNSLFLTLLYEKTDDMLFYHIARKTLDFILEEFNSDIGLFSSMDADSLNESGKLEEGYYYHVEFEGEDDEFLINNDGFLYFNDKIDYETYLKYELKLEEIKKNHKKAKPEKDTKIICGHNMLFVNSLLHFAEVTGDEYYFNQAVNLFNKVRTFQIMSDKVYRINYRSEIFKHETLEDYAYTLNTLIHFYEMTKEKEFLNLSLKLSEALFEKFYEDGYLFLDKDRSIRDTFDDALFSPVGLSGIFLLKINEFITVKEGISKIKDFLVDRGVKYPTGHPTILRFLKRVICLR